MRNKTKIGIGGVVVILLGIIFVTQGGLFKGSFREAPRGASGGTASRSSDAAKMRVYQEAQFDENGIVARILGRTSPKTAAPQARSAPTGGSEGPAGRPPEPAAISVTNVLLDRTVIDPTAVPAQSVKLSFEMPTIDWAHIRLRKNGETADFNARFDNVRNQHDGVNWLLELEWNGKDASGTAASEGWYRFIIPSSSSSVPDTEIATIQVAYAPAAPAPSAPTSTPAVQPFFTGTVRADPNPFRAVNPQIKFHFHPRETAHVYVAIYRGDVRSSNLKQITSTGTFTGGNDAFIVWDGKGTNGTRIPAGTYAFNVHATGTFGTADAIGEFTVQ